MRINNILHSIGLTLVGTLCLSICSAAQQTHSSSLGKLGTHVAADAIGFDSGLWRSEYLQQQKSDKEEGDASATDVMQSDVMTSTPVSSSAKSPPAAFIYSDNLVTIPLDTPALIESQGIQINGESTFEEEATMSEWENAVASSGGNATPGFTASGPSLTSAIVGCVGIMIVVGAYVSSGKRNR